MIPLVIFTSPEAALKTYLEAELPTHYDGWTATVSTSHPSASLVKSPTRQVHVQIEHEVGDDADFPVVERDQVRLTVHVPRGERALALSVASLVRGLVLRFQGGSIAGVSPGIGRSDVIADNTTTNLMVWSLVRVSTKASQVA